MAVTLSRSGSNLTVTITENVADIVAAVGLSAQEKKLQAIGRVQQQLANAVQAAQQADSQLDQEIAEHQAKVAALKAARPTGSF